MADTALSNHPPLVEKRIGMAQKNPVAAAPAKPEATPQTQPLADESLTGPKEPVQPKTPPRKDHKTIGTVAQEHPEPPKQSIQTNSARLHQACLSADPEVACAALLEWAGERWPDAPPHTLGSLASQFAGTDVEREIRCLDKILYSPVKREWHGVTLWQVMKGFMVEQEVVPHKRHLFVSFHTH
jgi:hypothetical protein